MTNHSYRASIQSLAKHTTEVVKVMRPSNCWIAYLILMQMDAMALFLLTLSVDRVALLTIESREAPITAPSERVLSETSG